MRQNVVRRPQVLGCSCVLALTLCWTGQCLGQQGSLDPESIQLTRTLIHEKRQEIVSNVIDLTEEEARAFWPLYRDWRAKMAGLGNRIVGLVEQMEENWNEVDEAQAKSILDEWLRIQTEELRLKKQYLKRFRQILPDKKVTRFYQLENKMDVAVNYNLATSVPLVE